LCRGARCTYLAKNVQPGRRRLRTPYGGPLYLPYHPQSYPSEAPDRYVPPSLAEPREVIIGKDQKVLIREGCFTTPPADSSDRDAGTTEGPKGRRALACILNQGRNCCHKTQKTLILHRLVNFHFVRQNPSYEPSETISSAKTKPYSFRSDICVWRTKCRLQSILLTADGILFAYIRNQPTIFVHMKVRIDLFLPESLRRRTKCIFI